MLCTVRFVLVLCMRVVAHAAQQPHYIPFHFLIDASEKLLETVMSDHTTDLIAVMLTYFIPYCLPLAVL